MTTEQPRPAGRGRPNRGIILAVIAVVLVLAITAVVLLLARGDQTGDGTGRVKQSQETTNTTGTATTRPSP